MPLGTLTLLTGRNSTGKSSIIQGLLFLGQNFLSPLPNRKFSLNGDAVSLGAFFDVLDSLGGRDEFSIGISMENRSALWTFTGEKESRGVVQKNSGANPGLEYEYIQRLLHVSPKDAYDAEAKSAISFLYKNERQPVSDRILRDDAPPLLLRQTGAWLAHFFPGAAFKLSPGKPADKIALQFRSSETGEWHTPFNAGCGLSHILPILAGGLSAGGANPRLLIVENPEAHLHPSAQSGIGMFLARAASAGAQVILESHSDHVLNGIRIAVKNSIIKPDDAKIHHFNPRGVNPRFITPVISPRGRLDNWPSGFFDQMGKDIDQLLL